MSVTEVSTMISVDGGGSRIIEELEFAKAIEKKTQRAISDLFDYKFGVSTGSIFILGMSLKDDAGKPRYSAATFQELCFDKVSDVFKQKSSWFSGWGLFSPKYGGQGLENLIHTIGGDAKGSEFLGKDFVVPATVQYPANIQNVYLMKGGVKLGNGFGMIPADLRMDQIIRPSSAAPYYFPSYDLKVGKTDSFPVPDELKPLYNVKDNTYDFNCQDGGIASNNPVSIGYKIIAKTLPRMSESVVCSIGSGHVNGAHPYAQTKGWGLLQEVPNLLSSMFATNIEQVNDGMAEERGVAFYRWDIKLQKDLPLSTTDRQVLEELCQNVRADLDKEANKDKMDAMCRKLLKAKGQD